MNGEHRKVLHTKTIHKKGSTSSSSSYYELDINYSPHKEKLYLQLQSINKDSLSDESNHEKVSTHTKQEAIAMNGKPVTENIKEKFLEEIMPLYMNHVATNKQMRKRALEKKKKIPQTSVCFCSFDYKQPNRNNNNSKQTAKTVNKRKQDEQQNNNNNNNVVNVIEPAKSESNDFCPLKPITTESVLKKSKEKGKLTTKKVPIEQTRSVPFFQNNSGDGSLQTTSLDDTTEEFRGVLSKTKNQHKPKPETITISTQVKPKHLKKIKPNESIAKNVIDAQASTTSKDLYFILVSQGGGFDNNKPIHIPVNVNELQKSIKFSGSQIIRQQKQNRDSKNNNLDKEIQTKMADACVSIQTSSVAAITTSTTIVQRSMGKRSKNNEDILSEQIKKRCKEGVVLCDTETSILSELPVKENNVKTGNIQPNPFFPFSFRNFQYTSKSTSPSSATNSNILNPFISNVYKQTNNNGIRKTTTSTNTENQFFLGGRLFPYPHQKAGASTKIKNQRTITSDDRTNERVLRTEISFSDLNLKPMLSYYVNNDVSKNNSCQPTDLIRFYAAARTQGVNKLLHRPKHPSLLQNIIETSKKECDKTINSGTFEVEGIEPAKKIGFDVTDVNKGKLCTSHFAVIEIKPRGDQVVDVAVSNENLDDLRGQVIDDDKKVVEDVKQKPALPKKCKPRKYRAFVRARWKTPTFRLTKTNTVKKRNLREIAVATTPIVSTTEIKRTEIVKKMKEADDNLAKTIDKVLRLDVTKKEVSIQSDLDKELKNTVSCGRGTKLSLIPSKIDEEIIVDNKITEKGTKLSLLSSEWGTKATSIQSKPSFSSGDSNNIMKQQRKRKKKLKPMLPVKIRNSKIHKQPSESTNKNQEKITGGIALVRSTTAKSQKYSQSTVVGPSLKSTQLFVSCGKKSSTSSKKPLASTFLFTKDYRNSKTKLSAFQKRKLYGEYIRKAETQNHSVHSICEIIVSEEEEVEKKNEKSKYAKKTLPKECNQEMKVVVKESPMHRFVFHNNKSMAARPPKRPRTNTAQSARKIITITRSKPKIRPTPKRNCFVLREMFNNKHFETDSATTIHDKDSIYEIFFSQKDGNNNASASSSSEHNNKKLDNLSEHARFLVERADQLTKKPPAKSCEKSLLEKRNNFCDGKSTKSCSDANANNIITDARSFWLPLPEAFPDENTIIAVEKFSTDSLEKPHTTPMFESNNFPSPPKTNVTIVAYNTEIKYDKDMNDEKSEINNSNVTFGESGYESNKSKNTLKRFFRRKFNIFKTSKMEILTRYPQPQSCSSKLDEEGSSYLCDEWSKETKTASKSVTSIKQQLSDACPSSIINVAKKNVSITQQAAKATKLNKNTKKMVTWKDLCKFHPTTQNLVQLCYPNEAHLIYYPNRGKNKNVLEITPMPKKLQITVATETNNSRTKHNDKSTNCSLKPSTSYEHDELFEYLDRRFQELERKIELAVHYSARVLQERSSMRNEDEFRVKDSVPETDISVGTEKRTKEKVKKPRMSVGTDGMFVSKEINTVKKLLKSCKKATCPPQADIRKALGCRCSTVDLERYVKKSSQEIADRKASLAKATSLEEHKASETEGLRKTSFGSRKASLSKETSLEEDDKSDDSASNTEVPRRVSFDSRKASLSKEMASETEELRKMSFDSRKASLSKEITVKKDRSDDGASEAEGLRKTSFDSRKASLLKEKSLEEDKDDDRGSETVESRKMSFDGRRRSSLSKETTLKKDRSDDRASEAEGLRKTSFGSRKASLSKETSLEIDKSNDSASDTEVPRRVSFDSRKASLLKETASETEELRKMSFDSRKASLSKEITVKKDRSDDRASEAELLRKTSFDSRKASLLKEKSLEGDKDYDRASETVEPSKMSFDSRKSSLSKETALKKDKSDDKAIETEELRKMSFIQNEIDEQLKQKSDKDVTLPNADKERSNINIKTEEKLPITSILSIGKKSSIAINGEILTMKTDDQQDKRNDFSITTFPETVEPTRKEQKRVSIVESTQESFSIGSCSIDIVDKSKENQRVLSDIENKIKRESLTTDQKSEKNSTESETYIIKSEVASSRSYNNSEMIDNKKDEKTVSENEASIASEATENIDDQNQSDVLTEGRSSEESVQPQIRKDSLAGASKEMKKSSSNDSNKSDLITSVDSFIELNENALTEVQSEISNDEIEDTKLETKKYRDSVQVFRKKRSMSEDDPIKQVSSDDFRRNQRSISFAAPKNNLPLMQCSDEEVNNNKEPTTPETSKQQIETLPNKDSNNNKSNEIIKQYTDQELFDKLLESYERENEIAERLSKDDEFFVAQLSTVRSKESVEKFIADTKKVEKQKKTGLFSKFLKHKGSINEIVPIKTETPSDNELNVIEPTAKYQETIIKKPEPKVPQSVDSAATKLKDLMYFQESDFQITAGTFQREGIEPREIGKCFRRGFRPDNIVLTGEPCLKVSENEQKRRLNGEATASYIDFSERDTPLEFLLGLGFSVDEASNAIKDEDVKNRLNAAITEARVWINRISTTQGTMLYLVAFKTRPKTMRYFLQLVEAIINQRIIDAVRLDGFLKLLEKIEEGNVNMVTILGMDKIDDEQNEENMVKKQLRKLFYDVYKIAEHEAAERKKELKKESIILLRILAAKYRAGLQPHLELIAKYIGQELLTDEVQLEAAMIYLARIDTAEVNLQDFEQYCAITCSKEKQLLNDKKTAKKNKKKKQAKD